MSLGRNTLTYIILELKQFPLILHSRTYTLEVTKSLVFWIMRHLPAEKVLLTGVNSQKTQLLIGKQTHIVLEYVLHLHEISFLNLLTSFATTGSREDSLSALEDYHLCFFPPSSALFWCRRLPRLVSASTFIFPCLFVTRVYNVWDLAKASFNHPCRPAKYQWYSQ